MSDAVKELIDKQIKLTIENQDCLVARFLHHSGLKPEEIEIVTINRDMEIVVQVRKKQLLEIDELQSKYDDLLKESLKVLSEFVDVNDEPCRLDHHGYCQAHYLEEDCLVKRAREFLRKWDKK